jgi:hypothetical protein
MAMSMVMATRAQPVAVRHGRVRCLVRLRCTHTHVVACRRGCDACTHACTVGVCAFLSRCMDIEKVFQSSCVDIHKKTDTRSLSLSRICIARPAPPPPPFSIHYAPIGRSAAFLSPRPRSRKFRAKASAALRVSMPGLKSPPHTHSPGRQSYAPEPYLAGARVAQLVPAYYPLSVSCAHRAAHTQRLHTHTTRSCPCTRGACDRRCGHQLRLPWQVSAHTRQQGKLRPQQSSGRRAAKRRRPTQDYTRAPNLQ